MLSLPLLFPFSPAAAQAGGQAEERRPSWIERLFGGGERGSKANVSENDADDTERSEAANAGGRASEKASERAEERRDSARERAEEQKESALERAEEADALARERGKTQAEMARERSNAQEEFAPERAKAQEELAREEGKRKAADARESAEAERRREFSDEERDVLEAWQRGEARGNQGGRKLPPGLQKKVDRGGDLPPGWKRKIEIGAVLDDEIEAKAESLPEEILRRLPEVANQDTEIMRIGDEIVRVMDDSREIVDILSRRGQ